MKDQTILHQKILRKILYLLGSHDFQLQGPVTKSVTERWLCHALESAKAEAPSGDSAEMTAWFTVKLESLTMTDKVRVFLNSVCCTCRLMQCKCNEEQPMGLQPREQSDMPVPYQKSEKAETSVVKP